MIQVMKPSGRRRALHHDHGGAVLVVGGVLAYAALAALTRPLTRAAEIACAIPAMLVLLLAVRRPPVAAAASDPAQPSQPLRRTALAWLGLLAVAAGWELAAWLQQPAYNIPSYDHPTISLLLDPLTESGPLRVAGWLGWLWAGWRLVRR